MYRAILVPLDGSPVSERALPYARFLAQAVQAELVLLRVVEVRPFTDSEETWNEIVAEAYIGRFRSDLAVAGLAETAVKIGNPAREILDAIKARDLDLIVMSTHGRSGLGRFLHGSVAEEVMRRSPVPILLVSPRCIRTWSSDRPGRVLVPLDGSELAEKALVPASQFAEILAAELHLIRVVAPSAGRSSQRTPSLLSEAGAGETAEAQDYLTGVAEGLRTSGRAVSTLVKRGNPADMISASAREEDADVIVIASHRRAGVSRLIQGSVAARLIQEASVPVCLVS
jgi:nucleotide-binding universal stress UspA family protein